MHFWTRQQRPAAGLIVTDREGKTSCKLPVIAVSFRMRQGRGFSNALMHDQVVKPALIIICRMSCLSASDNHLPLLCRFGITIQSSLLGLISACCLRAFLPVLAGMRWLWLGASVKIHAPANANSSQQPT